MINSKFTWINQNSHYLNLNLNGSNDDDDDDNKNRLFRSSLSIIISNE